MAVGINIPGFEISEGANERPGFAVYEGRQVSLDRAIKVLVLPEDLPPEVKQRYIKTHRHVAQLNHPNLVQAIEVGERDGRAYAIVEAVDGPPISMGVDLEGPPPWPENLSCAAALTAALAELHSQKLAHGDISPNAVYVGMDGRLRLMFTAVASPPAGPYVAPEREKNPSQSLTFTADVYSLGAVIYFLFTGRPPVRSGDGIKNPRDLAYMPEALKLLLDRMLSIDPGERPQDAKEALSVLQALGRGETPAQEVPVMSPFAEARSPITSPKVRRGGIPLLAYIAGGMVVTALVVIIAALLAVRNRLEEPPPDTDIPVSSDYPEEEGRLPDAGRRIAAEPWEDEAKEPADVEEEIEAGTQKVSASEIEQEFKIAELYADFNPDDLDGIISRFQTVARKSQSKRWSERCGEKVRYYREKLQDVIAERLEKDIATAKALAAEGKVDEAMALLLKFDDAMLNPRQMAVLKDAMDIVAGPLRGRADELEREFEKALAAFNMDQARAALIRLKGMTLPGVEEKAFLWEARIKELEDRLAKEASGARRKALSLLDTQEHALTEERAALKRLGNMEEELKVFICSIEFWKASRLVADSLGDLGGSRPVGKAYEQVIKRLSGRFSMLKARMVAIAAEASRITLHKGGISLAGKVSAVTEKSVILKLNAGPTMEVFYRDMEVSDFCRYSGMDTGVRDAVFDQAAMYLLRGEREKALELFKETEWKGELKPLAALLTERAGRAREREVEAAGLLIKARRAFYNGDQEALKPILNKLRHEFSDTRVYQENLER